MVSTFTVPSQALSSPETKAWIVRTGWVFCFNTTKIVTYDFVEIMQEKPCVSLPVLHLFYSENTCATLAGETRTLGFTTPRWRRQQRCSGSLWARCYCGSPGAKLRPLLLLPHLHKSSTSNGFPLLQGQHQAALPRAHLAWLHMTCSSKPAKLAAPSAYRIPERATRTWLMLGKHPSHRLLSGSHHFTNFKLEDNT